MELIETYNIPGIEQIAISTIEIYCNENGSYFGKFKEGLEITIPRDSLEETRIKMFDGVYKMLIHEKGIAAKENIPSIEKGLEYLVEQLDKFNQTPEINSERRNK